MQTLELSRAPVIASHSAVRALIDETRSLSDAELDAIAAEDGVVHVPPFNASRTARAGVRGGGSASFVRPTACRASFTACSTTRSV